EEFWALKDVNFQVKRGEVVGVIGRNGAGKSTLLKVLSRITPPTSGQIRLRGRVASLLEVGTGFHPELTGRENIFLNGAILGMSSGEIRQKFDEIVAFSEVEKFLDTPVKRYSSGMYVRLAFAVAAHLEPEILIVDEVLAVGDAAFQKKCLGKMKEVSEGGGRTVLFVSHNMQTMSVLTNRCVLMSGGRSIFLGPTSEAIDMYLGQGVSHELVYQSKPAPGQPAITRISLATSEPANTQHHGHGMTVELDVYCPHPIDGARLSFQVCSEVGDPISHQWIYDSEAPLMRDPGIYHLRCHLPKVRLNIGHYSITAHFGERYGGRKFETVERVCPFEVVKYGESREGGWNRDACKYIDDFTWQIVKK
ncbi:ABC transporter ATP-binding protein, partial [Cyanobium sp. Cruz-8H5]|uniref:ABC transporter ATP-binding protein n=1 Tax=Cyanobium sp. Cruz-8H5 TaxID=2823712 RepID=UPI0020CD904F